jgi:hypothetical protein
LYDSDGLGTINPSPQAKHNQLKTSTTRQNPHHSFWQTQGKAKRAECAKNDAEKITMCASS